MYFLTRASLVLISAALGSTVFAQNSAAPQNNQLIQQQRHAAIQFVKAQQNFEQVRQILLREAIGNSINEAKLFEAATQGMLRSLNQGRGSYNELLSPEQLAKLRSGLSGNFTGIGIEIDFIKENGSAIVKRILPGSPADENGLLPGDQILSVNGKRFVDQSMADMVKEIRGPIGEVVQIKFLRDLEISDKKIVRAKINMLPVVAKVDDNKIGYLNIRYFTKQTPQEIATKLGKFEEEKVKGIVLDLRRNVGGIFGGAVATADHFLPKGKIITKIVGRGNMNQVIKSKSDSKVSVPVVVLVNRETSSGAELLASSLKENMNATIIGQRTYGKWNAQSIRRLPNNFAIKYTVYEFRTPSNKSYHNVGLTPDVVIANPKIIKRGSKSSPAKQDKQLETAYNLIDTMI